ncbi:hypothetical protein CLCR_03988 [Cladophialophora carrionii]|uniref:Zn(2)-C6 fungal-type domain-containing protein n=1 Tax=Cladophialophora carrionii TaxID=86049 RepID=A0A1C1CJ01_9EURO|nr:hypothetical protein CLCR_03988 [Cladophialophora carrionii]
MCDEQRPDCSQCKKRGVVCPGYDKDKNPSVVRFDPSRNVILPPQSQRDNESSASHSTSHQAPVLVLAPVRLSPPSLPRSCNETAFRLQACGLFLAAYLPRHSQEWPRLETDLSVAPATGWLRYAVEVATGDGLLNDALSALSVAHLERLEKRQNSYRSSELYSKSVRELARRIQGADAQCLGDTTLAGVMALTTYEVQTGTTTKAKSWLFHVEGAASLVQFRGQGNFATKFGEHLYLSSQLNDLVRAIARRRRIPGRVDWSKIHYRCEKPSSIQLFDILQELPILMEHADAIKSSKEGHMDEDIPKHMLAWGARARTFEVRLHEWYARLEHHQAKQRDPLLFWPSRSTLYQRIPKRHAGRVFRHFFCFPNIAVAEQIVLYWAALLFIPRLLDHTRDRLRRRGEWPREPRSPLNSNLRGFTSVTTDPVEMATNIAQSLEYFLHPDAGLMELNAIAFPMNITLATFVSLRIKGLPWFRVIRSRLCEINTGVADFLEEMLHEGGGMKALRLLIPKVADGESHNGGLEDVAATPAAEAVESAITDASMHGSKRKPRTDARYDESAQAPGS